MPDIELYNKVNSELIADTAIVVRSSGDCSYIPPFLMTSTCKIDHTWFPWDEQVCQLKFGSWVYNGVQLNLKKVGQYKLFTTIQVSVSTSNFVDANDDYQNMIFSSINQNEMRKKTIL